MLKVENKVKRGRPSKKQIVGNLEVKRFTPKLVKMNEIKFDKNLFKPMKTGKKIDSLLSSEGGLMKGTNFAFVGDPGVGKKVFWQGFEDLVT